jgi:hypothetical protein
MLSAHEDAVDIRVISLGILTVRSSYLSYQAQRIPVVALVCHSVDCSPSSINNNHCFTPLYVVISSYFNDELPRYLQIPRFLLLQECILLQPQVLRS